MDDSFFPSPSPELACNACWEVESRFVDYLRRGKDGALMALVALGVQAFSKTRFGSPRRVFIVAKKGDIDYGGEWEATEDAADKSKTVAENDVSPESGFVVLPAITFLPEGFEP